MSHKRIKEEENTELPSPKRSKGEGSPVKDESVKLEQPDDSAAPPDDARQTVQFKQCTVEVRRAADGRLFADPPFPVVNAKLDIQKGLKGSSKQVIKKGDLDMVYFKPFLTHAAASALYSWCLQELPWFKVKYKARGMDINTPRYDLFFFHDWHHLLVNSSSSNNTLVIGRFTTTFGVDGSYTGQTMAMYDRPPRKIPDTLQTLLEAVSEATGIGYNFVLMNFYQDGTHSISYHSDDEKFLGGPLMLSRHRCSCIDQLDHNA